MHVKTLFEMTKDYISFESPNKKNKYKYDELEKVLIGKYTISFIPKDINKEFITTRIDYKDEIIDTLKKYKKDNLIK